jgi:hypothetical protein
VAAGSGRSAPITALLLSSTRLKYLKMQNSLNKYPKHHDDAENNFYFCYFAVGLSVGPK